jgi:sensor histidine kinase regulating citrate/malate metabolism
LSHGAAAVGAVTTLRDRSELLAVQRQLGATRNATDTLRAQTHEFDNQLHTISGLVQLGEFDEVRTLVGTITRHRSEIGSNSSGSESAEGRRLDETGRNTADSAFRPRVSSLKGSLT